MALFVNLEEFQAVNSLKSRNSEVIGLWDFNEVMSPTNQFIMMFEQISFET